jgi:hypothetical protein
MTIISAKVGAFWLSLRGNWRPDGLRWTAWNGSLTLWEP